MEQAQLIFLIGAPRSGSTLLQRMLASHSQISTHPEPHLLTPLAHLGYFAHVERAPYDAANAALAQREFVASLPQGEADYLDACRAYATTLYARALGASGKRYFLDKTPAYALVLPFIEKLFPDARYVVLTRHPLAILHSVAHSFFGGDYALAQRQNPIVERYVSAIGQFLLTTPVRFSKLRYEDLVAEPTGAMQGILAALGLSYEPAVVEYGAHPHVVKSFGDPHQVNRHTRPVTDSLTAWASDLRTQPRALELAHDIVERLDPEHLRAWGYEKDALLSPIDLAAPRKTRDSFNTYRVQRSVLRFLREQRRYPWWDATVRQVRRYCDSVIKD